MSEDEAWKTFDEAVKELDNAGQIQWYRNRFDDRCAVLSLLMIRSKNENTEVDVFRVWNGTESPSEKTTVHEAAPRFAKAFSDSVRKRSDEGWVYWSPRKSSL